MIRAAILVTLLVLVMIIGGCGDDDATIEHDTSSDSQLPSQDISGDAPVQDGTNFDASIDSAVFDSEPDIAMDATVDSVEDTDGQQSDLAIDSGVSDSALDTLVEGDVETSDTTDTTTPSTCISNNGPPSCMGQWGITYYVRPGGGNASQCNGMADIDYPGDGSGLDCAFSHPLVALPPGEIPLITGGDRLIISPGQYRMGYGAPEVDGLDACEAEGSYECHMPPIPSGISSEQPTCIVGAGWNDGCPNPPELFGAERPWHIIDLTGSSNVRVECLEITDHDECVEFHGGGIECTRDESPYGDWAGAGIYAEDSANVTLRNLDIHGLAHTGVWAGRLTDWTLEHVNIVANGWVGWDGDIGSSDNSGTITFRCVTIAWNGCGETYPGGEPVGCWAQQNGGYGDGLGTAATGANWVFEDCDISHNTSDGLDLLYHNGVGVISIDRTRAEGNAGNQIKTMGETHITNSVVVGNCGYFEGHPLMIDGDHCRAGGGAISLEYNTATLVTIVNSTIYSQGDVLISAEGCPGAVTLKVRNTIYLGDDDFLQPGDTSAIFWTDCDGLTFDNDYGLIFGVKEPEGYECPIGSHDLCTDPLLSGPLSGDVFGMQPTDISPAVDSGLEVGAEGLIPDVDILGNPRPGGAGVDRGAFEVQ